MGAPVTTSKALNSEHLEVEYPFKQKYGNFINGEFVEPKSGAYFENRSPITGEVINEIARSNSEDIESALDAAHSAFKSWKKTSTTERSNILLKIADTMETSLHSVLPRVMAWTILSQTDRILYRTKGMNIRT